MIHKNLDNHIKEALGICLESLKNDFPAIKNVPIELDIPKDKSHGDLSTNLAFKLSSQLHENPKKIAAMLLEKLKPVMAKRKTLHLLETAEVKPPGFINFWFGKKYLYNVLDEIEKEHAGYGHSDVGRRKKVQIEFVSANPTGPLTVAHGRQAAVGDSLANILKFVNYRVTREYYINDEGTQIELLGESIKARYLELLGQNVSFPENGYKGDYIIDIAKDVKARCGDRYKDVSVKEFSKIGARTILQMIREDLVKFGVNFNKWFPQSSLTKRKALVRIVNYLQKKNYAYQKDGALWFRSGDLGDDKDRVIIKSDGSYTYLLPDIAYHDDKFKKGFDRVINIWGPDHHGYIPRIKAAVKALGYKEDRLLILLVQLATLYRGDQVIPMSTRGGRFITLKEVVEEVGKDASRFFFLMRKTNSHLDFDLELAKKTSFDNPVYYIQYAHARIANLMEFAKENVSRNRRIKAQVNLLNTDEEIAVLRELRNFPYVIITSAQSLEPYFLILYLQNLATLFHRLYAKHRIVSDDLALSCTRLRLVNCIKIVLSRGLSLLGVSSPTKM